MSATVEKRTNPVEEIRAIREKIYEEIKDMTASERNDYWQKGAEQFQRLMKDRKPQPNMFPWLNRDKKTT